MKNINKFIAIVLCLLLVTTSFATVSAEESEFSGIVSKTVQVSGNGDVEVLIDIAGNPGITAFKFWLCYDTDVLTLKNNIVKDAELLEGTKAEDAVTSVGYGNVLPGVSLQYVLSGSSLKEYILVNEKSESYSYNFAMNLANLEPQMQEDGSILLKDAESGETVYEIPAGYMTDAAGAYSDAVSMSIDEKGDGNWILNVTADAEWINAEERVFPVQIDPTINTFLESKDKVKGSYVSKGFADMVSENYPNLMVGYDSGQSKQLRTFIKLRNLPNLPKDSVICKAVCLIFVENFSDIRHSDLVISQV